MKNQNNEEFVGHYKFTGNYRLQAILHNGKFGLITEYNCDKDYICVLLPDDNYSKCVPLKDIKEIRVLSKEEN